ncbi:hypothetical protein [Marinicella gelatinilytica]|uniref:hypothetical protein n=1 Tax=Marinicella gelatinilytica TaxID=2996017 RepID=UPI002260950B|nr:hypothetical protein [Marinicella gelatinilytica]MCX7545790.1 hypothetical protein [Marinicella gelatinilytica]
MISTVIAYLILFVGYYYGVQYVWGTTGHKHHDLLEGVATSVMYGFWPVALSVGLLTYCKCEMPVWLIRASIVAFFLWLILLLGSFF